MARSQSWASRRVGTLSHREFSLETIELYKKDFDQFQINRALDSVWELISVVNKYLVANQPWMMAKDPAKRDRLGTVLYNSAEALRLIAVMLGPVIPTGAASILRQLGVSEPLGEAAGVGPYLGKVEARFCHRRDRPGLSAIGSKRVSGAYRCRRTARKSGAASSASDVEPPAESQSGDRIGIEKFARIDMRVGKVLSAEGPAQVEATAETSG